MSPSPSPLLMRTEGGNPPGAGRTRLGRHGRRGRHMSGGVTYEMCVQMRRELVEGGAQGEGTEPAWRAGHAGTRRLGWLVGEPTRAWVTAGQRRAHRTAGALANPRPRPPTGFVCTRCCGPLARSPWSSWAPLRPRPQAGPHLETCRWAGPLPAGDSQSGPQFGNVNFITNVSWARRHHPDHVK